MLCAAGWNGIAETVAFDTTPLVGERDGWEGEALRLSSAQSAPPSRDRPSAEASPVGKLPGWATSPAAARAEPAEAAVAVAAERPEPATLSPLAVAGRDRFKRGLIVHRLLQSLPELPTAEREGAAARFLRSADAWAAVWPSRPKSAMRSWRYWLTLSSPGCGDRIRAPRCRLSG